MNDLNSRSKTSHNKCFVHLIPIQIRMKHAYGLHLTYEKFQLNSIEMHDDWITRDMKRKNTQKLYDVNILVLRILNGIGVEIDDY